MNIRKARMILSRGFGAGLLALVVVSESAWAERQPLVALSMFTVGYILATIAILGRMWCSLYIAGHKTDNLVTVGPYSTCRNPLYFFSVIGAIGIGLTTETFTIPAAILIAFAIYYPIVIREEEVRLRARHGDRFDHYITKTPAFFPKLSLLNEPEEYMTRPVTYRRHIWSALWFFWFIIIFEIIDGLQGAGLIPTKYVLY